MTYWCDGRTVPLGHAEWSRTAASFLGSGFRVRFPAGAAAAAHARRQVDAVADLLGTPVDPAPWAELDSAPAYEVAGGWERRLDRGWGPAWTAVQALALPPATTADAEAIDLPWAWSSASPTAGLPMISAIESDLARDHARGRVGLWWDHRDRLCSTTAGPPLVQAEDGEWLTPDASSGAVRSWAYDEAARRLDARPAALTREVVATARTVLAVSDLGVETRQMVVIRPD